MNASERITDYIQSLSDWRGEMLAQLRKLIGDAAAVALNGGKPKDKARRI